MFSGAREEDLMRTELAHFGQTDAGAVYSDLEEISSAQEWAIWGGGG